MFRLSEKELIWRELARKSPHVPAKIRKLSKEKELYLNYKEGGVDVKKEDFLVVPLQNFQLRIKFDLWIFVSLGICL